MSTFRRCLSLQHFSIPSSVKSIKPGAFYMCVCLKCHNSFIRNNNSLFCFHRMRIIKNRQTFIKPKNVGYTVFSECKSLEEISIPQSLIETCQEILNSCTSWNWYFISTNLKDSLICLVIVLAWPNIFIYRGKWDINHLEWNMWFYIK